MKMNHRKLNIKCVFFFDVSKQVNDTGPLYIKTNWQDSQFYEGMFGSVSEGGFVAKQETNCRFNFGLEMLNMSLEGEFTIQPDTQVFVVVHIFQVRNVQGSDASRAGGCRQGTVEKHADDFTSV